MIFDVFRKKVKFSEGSPLGDIKIACTRARAPRARAPRAARVRAAGYGI